MLLCILDMCCTQKSHKYVKHSPLERKQGNKATRGKSFQFVSAGDKLTNGWRADPRVLWLFVLTAEYVHDDLCFC